jgi:hypothetical protein
VVHHRPGAFATFEMEDASRVTLPSNTSLRIDRMRQTILNNAPQRVFQMDKGRGAISATPNSNPNAKFEVRTPVSISAVRGTEFRVGQDPSGAKAQTEVLKGAVGVDLAGATTSGPPVPAGFGVSATPAGVSAPVKLLPAPKLGDGGQRQGDKTVHFAVQPIDRAAAYRLPLSRDAGFVDIFAEATQPEPAVDFGEIANGTYFVRLTALDAGGLEGAAGRLQLRPRPRHPGAGRRAQRQASGKHRNFLFRWSAAGDGVRVFRFQLFAGTDDDQADHRPAGPVRAATDPDRPAARDLRLAGQRSALQGRRPTEKVGPMQTLQIGR